MAFYSRKNTRLPGYDYATENYYFITICTQGHQCIFGYPNELNYRGRVVQEHIEKLPGYYRGVKIDKFVVMPNHVHLIMILNDIENRHSVSKVIGLFKTGVTKAIRKNEPNIEIWQRSFHDHIIRNQKSYEKIWMYIDDNPRKWEEDCFYPKKTIIKE